MLNFADMIINYFIIYSYIWMNPICMALQRVTVRTCCVIVSLINRIFYGLLTYHLACTGRLK